MHAWTRDRVRQRRNLARRCPSRSGGVCRSPGRLPGPVPTSDPDGGCGQQGQHKKDDALRPDRGEPVLRVPSVDHLGTSHLDQAVLRFPSSVIYPTSSEVKSGTKGLDGGAARAGSDDVVSRRRARGCLSGRCRRRVPIEWAQPRTLPLRRCPVACSHKGAGPARLPDQTPLLPRSTHVRTGSPPDAGHRVELVALLLAAGSRRFGPASVTASPIATLSPGPPFRPGSPGRGRGRWRTRRRPFRGSTPSPSAPRPAESRSTP